MNKDHKIEENKFKNCFLFFSEFNVKRVTENNCAEGREQCFRNINKLQKYTSRKDFTVVDALF